MICLYVIKLQFEWIKLRYLYSITKDICIKCESLENTNFDMINVFQGANEIVLNILRSLIEIESFYTSHCNKKIIVIMFWKVFYQSVKICFV